MSNVRFTLLGQGETDVRPPALREAVQYKVTPDYSKSIPPQDFGPNLPALAVPLLKNMAGEIEVEFTSWKTNPHGKYVKSVNHPGVRIKNEGTHLSGTFT